MFKRSVAASAFALVVAAVTITGALVARADTSSARAGGVSASAVAAALPCAPSVQNPQCLLAPLTCHTRCSATSSDASPALPCAPSLQRPGCLLAPLTCHTRCSATSADATPAMPCAPSLQSPQCLLSPVTCHMRCSAPALSIDAAPASGPGDPCTHNWGEPINAILCHQ